MASALPTPPVFMSSQGETTVPWEEWLEIFENYLTARGDVGADTGRKVAILLCCLGTEGQSQYRAIKDRPVEMEGQLMDEYERVVARLSARFSIKKGLTATRFEFRNRRRLPGETLQELAAELHRLAGRCGFANYSSEEAVKEQFLVACGSEKVREKLLIDADHMEVDEVINTAIRVERSAQEAREIGIGAVQDVCAIERRQDVDQPQRQHRRCANCRMFTHGLMEACPAKLSRCYKCQQIGHYARCCPNGGHRTVNKASNVLVYSLSRDFSELESEVLVDGRPVKFLVDTGAGVTLIDKNSINVDVSKLHNTNTIVKSYVGEQIKVLGKMKCTLEFGGKACDCEVLIVPKGRPILGRDALAGLGVSINCASRTCEVNGIDKLNLGGGHIVERFGKVFSDKLGLVKGYQHRVKMKNEVRPVQQKLRRLPIMTRQAVKEEIDKLLETGVIEPIEASEWVSAVVVVAKKNGRVRLCIDLRQVNKNIIRRFSVTAYGRFIATTNRGDIFFLNWMQCRLTTRLN